MTHPHLKSLGVTRKTLSPEQVERVRKAREEGVTWEDIASRFAISAAHLRRLMKGRT